MHVSMRIASTQKLWDAIIVGAGPAGCAAAYDLAAAGRQVLLVDRAEFPRSKACAGGLTMKAVKALRYPIDPVVRHWVRSLVLEENAASAITVGRKAPVCAMTVREELDSFCLQKTIARGAVFRRVAALSAVEQSADRATLRFTDGLSLEARFVLGADGVHSRVRALATDANWFRSGFALEANVPYAPGEQPYPLTFDFAPVERGYGWLFPRDDHVNVGLYVGMYVSMYVEDAAQDRANASLLDRAALGRYIAARCGAERAYTRPVGQFLGLGAAAYRPEAGARILLAGDAAGFVDPLTGEGIYGAIRSGQAAAMAMHGALGKLQAQGVSRVSQSHVPQHGSTHASGTPLAQGFLAAAKTLQSDLRIAEHAAAKFYADPARGFRLMRLPLVPPVVLHAYSGGLSLTRLLQGIRVASRFASH